MGIEPPHPASRLLFAGMLVGDRTVGDGAPALVVAEIGANHDGSVRQAERLIEAAAEAGADAVKIQTHIAEAEMHPSTPTPPHFSENRWDFTVRTQLSLTDHVRLAGRAADCGLLFFSSPFSVEAVALLEEVGNPVYKVASGEVTNPPLLEAIAATGKPSFVSSGMSGFDDVARAVATLREGTCEVVVLQCTSAYPCPPERVHLRAMVAMGERLGLPYGLSDHTPDVWTSVAAVALGACVVEKHFTLSKRLYGPDHHASLTPDELARLVAGVREVEAALGSDEKPRDASLDPVRATFEKSIVSRVAIPVGTVIEPSMLTTKRPGTGIPAIRIAEVIGRTSARPIGANAILEETDLA